jgi:hypothetical protein
MRIFWFLRVTLKLFRCRVLNRPTNSFCKICGRGVHDFVAPEEIWALVEGKIRWGHTLCYDHFCEICGELGLPSVWRLVKLGDDNQEEIDR